MSQQQDHDFRAWLKVKAEAPTWIGDIAREVMKDQSWTGLTPASLIEWSSHRTKPAVTELNAIISFFRFELERDKRRHG